MMFNFLRSLVMESILGKIEGFKDPTTTQGKEYHYIKYNDKEWGFTGKTGVHSPTGERSFEYAHRDYEKRSVEICWVTINGDITTP